MPAPRIPLLALLLTLVACAGGNDVVGLPAVQDVVVSGDAQVALDATVRLSATPRGADGSPLTGRSVFWSTSDPQIATVDQGGLVTPQAIGTVRVAASVEGRSGVIDLQVVRKRARTIDVAAASEVAVGDTIAAQAVARATDGSAIAGVAPSFSSTAPEIATVTADGRIVGRSAGTVAIVATLDGVSETITVTVLPAPVGSVVVEPAAVELAVGQALPLRVTVRDRAGAPLAGRAVTYASSAPAVAAVAADGIVTAASPGTATITVASGGASATSRVTVVAPPVAPPPTPVPATLTVAPNVVSLQAGASQSLAATLRNSSGGVITGRPVTWRSSAPSIASVSATGVVTAVAPGAAVVTAESEGITGTAGVTVAAVAVDRVDVTPSDATVEVGATTQLVATPRSAAGAALAGRTVTWSSSAAGVATVSSTGEVRGVAAGTATITATSEGRQGTARVTVTAPPPPVPAGPARVEIVSGDDQTAKKDKMLPEALVGRVVDAAGRPVAGVSVLWVTLDGGRLTPSLDVTDAQGLVSTKWRLGDREGRQRTQLVVLGLEPATFVATAEKD